MTRLAIVGASVRAAAQSALRAGFEVVGADLFADADMDGVCPVTRIDDYPNGFPDWLAAQETDAWLYTGGLENHPELIDRMAAIAPLWGVRGEALRRCRDPITLAGALSKANVEFPRTLPLGVPPYDNGCYLGKSYRHSAGVGVHPYRSVDHRTVFAQEFVEGEPHAAVIVATNTGATRIGLTRQLLGEREESFSYRGSIGPRSCTPAIGATLQRLGDTLAGELGLRGVVGVDLLIDGDTLTVVEVNPRFPSSAEALELATGGAALAEHAAVFGGTAPPPWPEPFGIVGKRIVYARESTTVSATADRWLRKQRIACCLADIPREGTRIEAGQPIATALVLAATEAEVEAALHRIATSVHRRLAEGASSAPGP